MPHYSQEERNKTVEKPDYSDEEIEYRGYLIDRMVKAQEMRDQPHDELDGMTYLQYYETNVKAASGHIPPKKNPEDTRIVTGVTEDKEKTLLSAILNFNLEPNITAFDKSNSEIVELGENMEAMIDKSRLLETPDYEMKRPLVYKELLDQGTNFVEDIVFEWNEVEKTIPGKDKLAMAIKLEKNWTEKLSKTYSELRSNLIAGPNVYLGNIKEFFIDNQPYLFTREYMSYSKAETLYQDWERWQYVPKKISSLKGASTEDSIPYRDWSLLEGEEGFVEILKYQDRFKNEYQIMINGVMMLPVGFPLAVLTGKNMYTLVKGDINPISPFFAYSRSVPAATKVDQSILDEFYRLIILKTQKSFMPSIANNTGRVLSKKIFLPGNIVDDVAPDEIQEIGDANGVSPAEFQAFQLIKQQIDEKSISPVFQGNDLGGRQTATEILELKKQSEKKLGLALWGVTNLERNLAWLRLNNIINIWTEKEDTRINKVRGSLQSVFRRIEVDDTFDDGVNGTRIIEFSEDQVPENQIAAQERLLSKKRGKNVRKFVINPRLLKNMKINWQIIIEPTQKDSDQLDKAQFSQDVIEGYQIFGPQAFNQDYLKAQWAIKHKMDKEKLFVREQPMMQPGAEEMPQSGPGGTVNDRLRQATRGTGSGVSVAGKA